MAKMADIEHNPGSGVPYNVLFTETVQHFTSSLKDKANIRRKGPAGAEYGITIRFNSDSTKSDVNDAWDAYVLLLNPMTLGSNIAGGSSRQLYYPEPAIHSNSQDIALNPTLDMSSDPDVVSLTIPALLFSLEFFSQRQDVPRYDHRGQMYNVGSVDALAFINETGDWNDMTPVAQPEAYTSMTTEAFFTGEAYPRFAKAFSGSTQGQFPGGDISVLSDLDDPFGIGSVNGASFYVLAAVAPRTADQGVNLWEVDDAADLTDQDIVPALRATTTGLVQTGLKVSAVDAARDGLKFKTPNNDALDAITRTRGGMYYKSNGVGHYFKVTGDVGRTGGVGGIAAQGPWDDLYTNNDHLTKEVHIAWRNAAKALSTYSQINPGGAFPFRRGVRSIFESGTFATDFGFQQANLFYNMVGAVDQGDDLAGPVDKDGKKTHLVTLYPYQSGFFNWKIVTVDDNRV